MRLCIAAAACLFLVCASSAEPTGAGDFTIDAPRATGGPVVRAADFGFSPASDKNAAAIMRALAECRRVKASRLELAPGTYRCFDEPGVVVRDFTDFTLDGRGAVLVFRRAPEYRCQPQSELILDKGNLLVQRCLRTEVRDLVMDWDWEGDPLASFVRVTRRNLDEAHPENAWMELTFVDYERHPKYPEPVPVQKLMAMDECRTRFRAGPGLSCGQTEGHFGAKNEWVAPNVLRVWPGIPMPNRNQNPATRFAANPKWNLQAVRRFAEGGLYRLQHCYYGKNGINLDSNRHLTVRDVRVWACFGMAMVTDGAQEYWQVERLRVAPPTAEEFAAAYPGKRFFERPVSSTSDGHHVARSKGHCKYVDCYWTRNNDDSSNFHDRFTIAVKVAPRKLYVINRRGTAYFRAEPGAPLELRHPDFSPAGYTAKLVRVNKELLELDRDIPDQKGPCFLVWDRTYGTDWVLFKGCTCEDSGWRNIFSPSNLTIEDCTFRRTPGVPLRLIADWRADLWCEGMGATNVVIRNCTFADTGTLVPKEGQISTRCVVPEGWDIPPPDKDFVGGDVLIEKCTFVRPTGPVLDLPTGRNVTMRDCTVDLRGIQNATPSAGAFNTAGAENVRIERITTLRDGK